jgi:hypothetical protein
MKTLKITKKQIKAIYEEMEARNRFDYRDGYEDGGYREIIAKAFCAESRNAICAESRKDFIDRVYNFLNKK